ncbi:hypothetical protein [Methylocystis sp. ATCC 49242]|uniref:hypothetical protein n=1 Tax=Methylocystis sp. ATCC 49242 TaxID=622637 RepID=UPI0001F86D51|nr:hypothetical protein [Methylocystis sp. ATCC 49242]
MNIEMFYECKDMYRIVVVLGDDDDDAIDRAQATWQDYREVWLGDVGTSLHEALLSAVTRSTHEYEWGDSNYYYIEFPNKRTANRVLNQAAATGYELMGWMPPPPSIV